MSDGSSLSDKPDVSILECTLRDGSYAVNFQFTSADTEDIATALDEVGFPFIEVGHGIGLGASEAGLGEAAESDENYMKATASAVKRGKWGMFCIPGVATLEHVDMARDYEMDFIRVGTNVNEAELAAPFVERAKKYGMFVATNFMKSYAVPPKEMGLAAKAAASYGADMVYVVDSAGGMLTQELSTYFKAVQDVTDVMLGFHGHNNLQLAVANSLMAAEMGVAVGDSSLQGFGRSSGNTPTELILLSLLRAGFNQDIDPIAVLDIGERCVRPLIDAKGLYSLDMVCGYAQFHSSYMGLVREMSSRHKVDPRKLIIEICRHDLLAAEPEFVDQTARNMAANAAASDVSTARFRMERYHGQEEMVPSSEQADDA